MATATLSFSNLQQHEQTWSTEGGLMSPKSPEPSPEWGQSDNANPTFSHNNESNSSNKTNLQNNESPDSSESDEILYNQDEKNREIRECLKNIQTNDDPDKAHWNYFKTLLEQEGQEKAQMAYLNYIKNERVLACLQAYKAQEEAKYQWSERQRLKEEQLSQYKHLINLEEVAMQNRVSQQALSEIDYFKSKWESYALPANTGITPEIYRDIVNKGRLLNSQDNLDLLQQNANCLQYGSADVQQIGLVNSNVHDILDVDPMKYYMNTGLQDQKLSAQYLAQQSAQKLSQPMMKRIVGSVKGDSNALDDVMADFQANGRDSTAPPSPRASRAWGTTSANTTTPVTARPTLQNLRHLVSPAVTAGAVGNVTSSMSSPTSVNPLTNALPRGTEAELIRQLMLMNLGATSAQLQKQQQLYTSQAQYGLQLGSLTDSQFRRRRVTVASTECAFCRNNGEQPAVYRGHILKDAEGRVRCPILRDYTCRNCGATGDLAHTVKYCPLTPKTDLSFTQLQKNLRMANGKRRGSQDTTQWTTCDSP